MDFQKLISRYKQFGGAKLVWQYVKLGALGPAIKAGVRCLLKRQSFKAIYPEVLRKIEPFLIQKYGSKVQEFKKFLDGPSGKAERNGSRELMHEHPKVIWWCWLQGYDAAPPIVKACYNSLMREFKGSRVQGLNDGYEIKVIDGENWKEYIELPDFIVKKWEKKQIPPAMFSDLLRVELLIKYGGTWIDSTVLCTGVNDNHNDNENKKDSKLATDSKLSTLNSQLKHKMLEFLDADLFLFQYTKQGSITVSISNWFISAHSNNEVLIVLRDMLYAYWKDFDCVLDYYVFHLFFAMISKEYPEQMAAMPYAQSQRSLVLLHHWGEEFDRRKWDKLTSEVCFHKLAFRVSEEVKKDKENYYNYILTEYGRI